MEWSAPAGCAGRISPRQMPMHTSGSWTCAATAGVLLTLKLPAVANSIPTGWLIDRFYPRAVIAIDKAQRGIQIAHGDFRYDGRDSI
jgi:hypothetical protein